MLNHFSFYLINIAVGTLLVLAAVGLGRPVIYWTIRNDHFSPAFRCACSLICGAGVGGMILSCLFMVTLSYWPTLGLLGAAALLGGLQWELKWQVVRDCFPQSTRSRLVAGGLLLFGIILLLLGLTPPTAGDVLNYHFDLPLRWLYEGKWTAAPDHPYAGLPSLMHAWNAAALSLRATAAPVLLLLALQGAFCIVLWNAAEKLFSRSAAGAAVAVYLFSPLFVLLSTAAFTDAPVTVFCGTSFAMLFLLPRRAGAICLSALVLGFAAGTKTTGLLLFPLWGAALLLWSDPMRNFKSMVLYGVLGMVVAMGVALPFYCRTWYWFGNPFYPASPRILNEVFTNARFHGTIVALPHRTVTDILLIWKDLVFAPWKLLHQEAPLLALFMFSPLTLLLLPPACLLRNRRRCVLVRLLLLLLLFYGLTALIGGSEIRFYYAMEGVAALAAGGAFAVIAKLGPWFKWMGYAAMGVLFFMTLGYACFGAMKNLPFHLGLISHDEFLNRNTSCYNIYRSIMNHTPETAVIGVCCGNTYHLQRRQIRISRRTLFPYMEYRSADDWRRAFAETPCDYVLLSEAEKENRNGACYPLVRYLEEHGKLVFRMPVKRQGRWGQLTGIIRETYDLYQLNKY